MFDQAAAHVGALTSSVQRVDVSAALRGGTLTSQVIERLAMCSAMATGCIGELHAAAALCQSRAAAIANYESELRVYDEQLVDFEAARRRWSGDYTRWVNDDGAHPGPSPRPPAKPLVPGAWADVRRV